MKNNFPKNFLFGAATSALQSESDLNNQVSTTWDLLYDKQPDYFYKNVGPKDTNDLINHYNEDIDLLKFMNLNSYRTSISWSRIFPSENTINQEAIIFYKNYFTKIKQENITLFVNLFHFDMPLWVQKKGGWLNRETAFLFKKYSQLVFEIFHDLVDYWITFNEPTVHIECGYLSKCHYPMIQDIHKMFQVGFNTLLAHKLAVETFKKMNINSKIGIVLIMAPVYSRSNSKKDSKAKQNAESIFIKSFSDAVINGVINKNLLKLIKEHQILINYEIEDIELIKKYNVDFIGANYYQPIRVKRSKKNKLDNSFDVFFQKYKSKKSIYNPYRGWEIYPKGIYDMAIFINKNYPNIKWYVSENGIGLKEEDGDTDDYQRIDFIKKHLSNLNNVLPISPNCFGYHYWTLVDNWSWLNGYKNRYGLVNLNHKTKKRKVKNSGLWIKGFLEGE